MPLLRLEPHMVLGKLPQVKHFRLQPSFWGNIQTVDFMKQLVKKRAGNPVIRQLAHNVLIYDAVPSHNYLDESKAVGGYVQRNMHYVQDAVGHEQVQDPLKMARDIIAGRAMGDCDDQALMVATLLAAIGHKSFFRVVRYQTHSGPFNHIYVVDYQKNGLAGEKQRIAIDPIIEDKAIGWEVPHRGGKEIEAAK